MGWILPGLIKNRVRFGFKKKAEAGPGRVWVLVKTQPESRSNSTWLAKCKIIKRPIYIYIYISHNPNPKNHFSHFSLNLATSLASFSLTLTLILTLTHISSSPSPSLTDPPSPSWRSTNLVVVAICHGGARDP